MSSKQEKPGRPEYCKMLDLSTPELKAAAREALPALFVGGIMGNEQAARAAGEIMGDMFADVLRPSVEALARLRRNHD